jgi:Zn-dependent protease/CBS domain-containing protein
MRGGLHIGRIFGIQIILDFSWVVIFLLVTWNLASTLTRTHPEWGTGPSLSLAVAGALLFFGSVLVHELAHALVAIAQGLSVHNITLFIFGGVANIQREPPSPRAEFLITIVGPIASFALGMLFLALNGALDGLSVIASDSEAAIARLGPLSTMLLWLGSVNLILGTFNMIPGFPLDGGRVLRALLWALTDDRQKATRWASWIGRAIAWLFIVAGIALAYGARLPVFGTGLASGLWLIFIGWFLNKAAIQSYQQTMMYALLEGVPVAQLARSNVPSINPSTSIGALLRDEAIKSGDSAIAVLWNDQLVGLIDPKDVRMLPRDAWETTTARQMMTPVASLAVTTPEERATDALRQLADGEMGQIPVLHAGRLVGMLHLRDITGWLNMQVKESAR